METKEQFLIKFLEQTKRGEYAEIEISSLDYLRIKEETIVVDEEDNYYYGISN